MKRWIHAATKSQSEQAQHLASVIWDYISNTLFKQDRMGYHKQVRKQFTVNGRKYVMKNYSPYNKMVITDPEGEILFESSFRNGASSDDARQIAAEIINDAYKDDTDMSNKIVNLTVRANYTSYGHNSGGPVMFAEYVDKLRKYYSGDNSEGRYFTVMIKAWWSSHDQDVIFSDNANELIKTAKQFIAEGSADSSDCRYYADVVDSETGEELYADKVE